MANAKINAIVIGGMIDGLTPKEIDAEYALISNTAHDAMVDMWIDDRDNRGDTMLTIATRRAMIRRGKS